MFNRVLKNLLLASATSLLTITPIATTNAVSADIQLNIVSIPATHTQKRTRAMIAERFGQDPIADFAFLDNGSFFVVAENGDTTFVHADGLREHFSVALDGDRVRHALYSDVFAELVYITEAGHILLYPMGENKGDVQAFTILDGELVNSATLSANGQQLFAALETGALVQFDLADKKIVATLNNHDEGLVAINLMPGSTKVLSTDWLGRTSLWDVETGNVLAAFDAASELLNIDVSADGKRILATTLEGDIYVWDVESPKAPFVLIQTEAFSETSGQFAQSENHILFARDNILELFDLSKDSAEVFELAKHEIDQPIVSIAKANNNVVATASLDGTAQVWDFVTREKLATLEGHDRDLKKVTLSANGKEAFTLAHDGSLVLWHIE